jgi:hypothetical protein
MPLTSRDALLSRLSPPLDRDLALQAITEFIDLERRYIQRDWGPTEVDGGRFCEAIARILYHQDSGNLDPCRELGNCAKYIDGDQNPHRLTPRTDAKHLFLAMGAIWKFRNSRGAAHLSPNYNANHMDARFVVEGARWVMNEMLRLFGQGEREEVAKMVRELLRFEVPVIGKFESVLLVQRTDLKA